MIISNGSFLETDIEVTSIEYSDSELILNIAFSGCDDEKNLDLVWDGGVNESLPPQVSLIIVDNDGPEACLAFFRKEICFDITELTEALKDETSVIIHVDNDKNIEIDL